MQKIIHGWGAFPKGKMTHVLRPENTEEIAFSKVNVISRGLGRSYGDAAMNNGQTVISTERLNRFLSFDPQNGRMKAEAGISLGEILEVIIPHGWFLPVTPGTKFVTLGGAISADVHGKNHHVDGCFGDHVIEFNLRLADQSVVRCSRGENTQLFWAVIGGFGLLGIIEDATIKLKKIETAYINQQTYATNNLNETFDLLESNCNTTYSVAWIDCLASGDQMGRGIILLGEHAKTENMASDLQPQSLNLQTSKEYKLPKFLPFSLTPLKVKIFNFIYYTSYKNALPQKTVYYDNYFYPLDTVLGWNKIYGRDGFMQFQCLLPLSTYREGLQKIMKKISESGKASFLAVLKRFGVENEGYLSFPLEGYTLALDIPYSIATLALVQELNQITYEYNGRLYLAKDSCMTPCQFLKMYPKYTEWKKIKDRYDPHGLFRSDLSRRIMEKVE